MGAEEYWRIGSESLRGDRGSEMMEVEEEKREGGGKEVEVVEGDNKSPSTLSTSTPSSPPPGTSSAFISWTRGPVMGATAAMTPRSLTRTHSERTAGRGRGACERGEGGERGMLSR